MKNADPGHIAQCARLSPQRLSVVAREQRLGVADEGAKDDELLLVPDREPLVGKNGDLCLDTNPHAVIHPPHTWIGAPEYAVYDVPGATHAGAGAIYDNEWAMRAHLLICSNP